MSKDGNMLAIAERLHAELAQARDLLEGVRIAEALLFASAEPLAEDEIAARLPAGVSVEKVMEEMVRAYSGRGVNCVCIAGRWALRTAHDLSDVLVREVQEPRKLSRAAMETLAIIAYHQPVTRAEIEEIRGVSTSKGTLDTLIETGWVRLRGRRRSPGRPVTYGTTPNFLDHFGLEQIDDLPGLEELKGAGFIEGRIPPGMSIPSPSDAESLREDEDPLDDSDLFMPLPIEGDDDEGGDDEGDEGEGEDEEDTRDGRGGSA
ncbi:MAG: segregation and condensation protein ScpB [Saliniramus fredricksonii]|uniref:Condensin subunit ScpB n=1 Tax=Saliniramus fredricksonii TaxID=1653334 RepID=A0A0P7XRQ5_9HYPH|nr:SMC-Scp complex subunit ScpB [Saliniramus fredricksonii]KPQ10263.1 MAG: segregation and condensation protein ScpB [Saliniramus fredricksonii]SCC81000.1 condensin subunit ScpB [Saliniramus fredricksonii]